MFVTCMFCDEPRDGVVDHEACNLAGAASAGHFLVAASIGEEDY